MGAGVAACRLQTTDKKGGARIKPAFLQWREISVYDRASLD